MSNFFTNPEDLTRAIMEVVNPGPVVVPTIREQLREVIRPGRAICFRTESGSLYDMTCFEEKPTLLQKVEHDAPGGMKRVAEGEMVGAYDPNRNVMGIRITEPSGRTVTTSAVVKVWLSYDAIAGTWHEEP